MWISLDSGWKGGRKKGSARLVAISSRIIASISPVRSMNRRAASISASGVRVGQLDRARARAGSSAAGGSSVGARRRPRPGERCCAVAVGEPGARAAPGIIVTWSSEAERKGRRRRGAPALIKFRRSQSANMMAMTTPRQSGPPTSFCLSDPCMPTLVPQLRNGRDVDFLFHLNVSPLIWVPTRGEEWSSAARPRSRRRVGPSSRPRHGLARPGGLGSTGSVSILPRIHSHARFGNMSLW